MTRQAELCPFLRGIRAVKRWEIEGRRVGSVATSEEPRSKLLRVRVKAQVITSQWLFLRQKNKQVWIQAPVAFCCSVDVSASGFFPILLHPRLCCTVFAPSPWKIFRKFISSDVCFLKFGFFLLKKTKFHRRTSGFSFFWKFVCISFFIVGIPAASAILQANTTDKESELATCGTA